MLGIYTKANFECYFKQLLKTIDEFDKQTLIINLRTYAKQRNYLYAYRLLNTFDHELDYEIIKERIKLIANTHFTNNQKICLAEYFDGETEHFVFCNNARLDEVLTTLITNKTLLKHINNKIKRTG